VKATRAAFFNKGKWAFARQANTRAFFQPHIPSVTIVFVATMVWWALREWRTGEYQGQRIDYGQCSGMYYG
jgi:hypothetical protein